MTRTSVGLTVCLCLICCTLPLMAQRAASADDVVPAMVKFTGTLNDTTGKPLTGTIGVTFLLYKEQTGGAPLWMETQNLQPDKNGHYSVMLGAATAHGLPAESFTGGEARWLGVQPSGQDEQPRVVLVSVPYALKALDAETLGGRPASAFMAAQQSGSKRSPLGPQAEQANEIACSSTTACKTGFVPLFSTNGGSAKLTDSIVTQSGTTVAVAGSETATGNISAGGNVSASGNLIASGGVTAFSLLGSEITAVNTLSGTIAILGQDNLNDGSQTVGVLGETASTSGVGLWGYNTSSGSGVIGQSVSGKGVYGNGGVGVFGTGSSYGFQTDSNVQQARTAGGWVKAMLYYSGLNSGRIVSCFNSTLAGAAATTPPCGFAAQKVGTGDYLLDFGFQIDDRFLSIGQTNWFATTGMCTDWNGACSTGSWTPNQVEVFSFIPSNNSYFDTKFYLLIY
jgi:hypothetical protein